MRGVEKKIQGVRTMGIGRRIFEPLLPLSGENTAEGRLIQAPIFSYFSDRPCWGADVAEVSVRLCAGGNRRSGRRVGGGAWRGKGCACRRPQSGPGKFSAIENPSV